MRIQRISAGWQVLAPAKLNLFLEVLSRRADGFHELETLMVPIDLYDTLTFHDDPTGRLRLECRWAPGLPSGAWESLPLSDDNIALRAVKLLRQEAGIDRGAILRLTKRIPSAAGLGGGSSDAAAALIAADRGWGLNWPSERLHALAAQLGSDVPFFLGRGPAICRGRGEQIEPLAGLEPLDVVVVCPPEGLSTAAVYRQCRAADEPRSVAAVAAPLDRGDRRGLVAGLYNRLEESARQLSGWIGRAIDALSGGGCLAAQMSGSGSSCFGVCANARQARAIAQRCCARGWSRTFAVRTL